MRERERGREGERVGRIDGEREGGKKREGEGEYLHAYVYIFDHTYHLYRITAAKKESLEICQSKCQEAKDR